MIEHVLNVLYVWYRCESVYIWSPAPPQIIVHSVRVCVCECLCWDMCTVCLTKLEWCLYMYIYTALLCMCSSSGQRPQKSLRSAHKCTSVCVCLCVCVYRLGFVPCLGLGFNDRHHTIHLTLWCCCSGVSWAMVTLCDLIFCSFKPNAHEDFSLLQFYQNWPLQLLQVIIAFYTHRIQKCLCQFALQFFGGVFFTLT